eukprot:TRINITY_DN3429_c0_g1_i1.p1 TRINITY_DN3429_c0_g1~~TRINITY_DN3429_c0_g1_i1.p1  ORF type:complete len:292 (+),score=45.70 TRINITY_DN3429_c0_g1_i1:31-876(+)
MDEAHAEIAVYPCSKGCGRSFAAESLARHEKICEKVFQKKRKAFDSTAKRLDGLTSDVPPLRKKGGRAGKEPPKPKKKDWRATHEAFVANVRAARQVTKALKEGKDIRDIPVVASAPDPDLVGCPHCGRSFSDTAAERHIPWCKEQQLKKRGAPKPAAKAKPAAPAPKPAAARINPKPKPAVAKPKPAAKPGSAGASRPAPVAARPAPVAARPAPVAARPAPVASTSAPRNRPGSKPPSAGTGVPARAAPKLAPTSKLAAPGSRLPGASSKLKAPSRLPKP